MDCVTYSGCDRTDFISTTSLAIAWAICVSLIILRLSQSTNITSQKSASETKLLP
ncbi:MAG: hypothetical protein KME32_22845 [Mojavia pulchra JT2-VF2]|uniref:Uncharacterized protein n=1 Tax=Mojavia pulchra JT2-VF2 TaxID=287848 RepID=A0A951Q4C6_9NOST|nr:hypothetical protein [Mojavia pulchra JT2-VF2]